MNAQASSLEKDDAGISFAIVESSNKLLWSKVEESFRIAERDVGSHLLSPDMKAPFPALTSKRLDRDCNPKQENHCVLRVRTN
jgi:hypothetical protein